MTIGIYIITFEGTDKVYIGQSVNIEDRWASHLSLLKQGGASTKLQEAFNSFGQPTFSILESCSIKDLDTLEITYIEEFNSIESGLNTCYGGHSYSGVHAPTSIYSKDQIVKVFELLADNNIYTIKEASDLTKVPISAIRSISTEKTHTWVKSEFPDLWKKFQENTEKREYKTRVIRGTKLSSSARGTIYPILVDSEGTEYVIENARRFALANNIQPANLGALLNGRRNYAGGFKRKIHEDRPIKTHKK